MGGCGGGDTKTNTKFRRQGGSRTRDTRSIPDFLETLLQNNVTRGDTTETLGAAQNTFLEGLLSNDYKAPPGVSELQAHVGTNPTNFTGESAMSSIANVDPFSEDYKAGYATFFDDLFKRAAAAGRTGPEAVRGGTAHGAMMSAELGERAALDSFREITALQQKQADATTSAGSAVNAIENSRRGLSMAAQDNWVKQWLQGLTTALGGASEITKRRAVNNEALTSLAQIIGTRESTTQDDLSGQGAQESSHFGWGAGVNCCFILLEALNGELPWYVRRGRDLFCTPQRVSGYKSMASWLVPAMKRSRGVRFLVNWTMVKPFLTCGSWYFGAGSRYGWFTRPICEAWFKVWDVIGSRRKDCYG